MTNFKTTKFISWIIFWGFVFLPFFVYSAPSLCGAHSRGHCVVLQSAAVAGTPILDQLGINLGRNIGDIFMSLYQFGLGLVGIAALVMIVVGGVMYMTAGDSQNRLSRGKTFISNAIFGLVLALLSWILLYTINPDLVQKLELSLPGQVERRNLLLYQPLYNAELSENLPTVSDQMAARRNYFMTQEHLSAAQAGAMVEGEAVARVNCFYSDVDRQNRCREGAVRIYRDYRDRIAVCISGAGVDSNRCRRDQGITYDDMVARHTDFKRRNLSN